MPSPLTPARIVAANRSKKNPSAGSFRTASRNRASEMMRRQNGPTQSSRAALRGHYVDEISETPGIGGGARVERKIRREGRGRDQQVDGSRAAGVASSPDHFGVYPSVGIDALGDIAVEGTRCWWSKCSRLPTLARIWSTSGRSTPRQAVPATGLSTPTARRHTLGARRVRLSRWCSVRRERAGCHRTALPGELRSQPALTGPANPPTAAPDASLPPYAPNRTDGGNIACRRRDLQSYSPTVPGLIIAPEPWLPAA
jgi:hypothetical protein